MGQMTAHTLTQRLSGTGRWPECTCTPDAHVADEQYSAPLIPASLQCMGCHCL